MPNIPEYNAPTNYGGPGDRASAAHVMAGRRIAQQYNEAGAAYQLMGHEIGGAVSQAGRDYTDYITHKEISAGTLGISNILLGKTQEWNGTVRNADPNDPSLQGKFMDGLEGQLQKFKESFITEKGQEWADQKIAHIREHFANVTTADTSTIAGIAAHNNWVQTANTLSATVDKDPSSIVMAADMLKASVDDTMAHTPNLKGTAAVQFQTEATQKGMEQLVRAGIMSDIRNGGDGSRIANDPRFAPYVNVVERQQMVQWQRREDQFVRADERAKRQYEREQKQNVGEDTLGGIIRDLNSPNPKTTRQTINDLYDQGKLPERYYEHAIAIFDRDTKPQATARVSQENTLPLYNSIRAPIGDPSRMTSLDKVYEAYGQGKINKQDRDDLIKTYMELRSPEGQKLNIETQEFLRQHKATFGHMIGDMFEEEQSGQRFYKYEKALEAQMDDYRRQGKNPRDLIDPTKPEFFGDSKVIMKYLAPIQAEMRGMHDNRPRPDLDTVFKGAGTSPTGVPLSR